MAEYDDALKTLWVGGLSSEVTEEILFELFINAGPLLSVTIPIDRDTQKQKNFAFVKFQHKESVPYAMDLFNDTKLFKKTLMLQNRTLTQNPANHSNSRKDSRNSRNDSRSSKSNNEMHSVHPQVSVPQLTPMPAFLPPVQPFSQVPFYNRSLSDSGQEIQNPLLSPPTINPFFPPQVNGFYPIQNVNQPHDSGSGGYHGDRYHRANDRGNYQRDRSYDNQNYRDGRYHRERDYRYHSDHNRRSEGHRSRERYHDYRDREGYSNSKRRR